MGLVLPLPTFRFNKDDLLDPEGSSRCKVAQYPPRWGPESKRSNLLTRKQWATFPVVRCGLRIIRANANRGLFSLLLAPRLCFGNCQPESTRLPDGVPLRGREGGRGLPICSEGIRRAPEGVRMLVRFSAVATRGETAGSDQRVAYTWEWLTERNGLEAKAVSIAREKFSGSDAAFNALDRDGDGKIAPSDLDWSDRNPFVMQTYMLNRLFRRMESGGDGKLTREELDGFFKMIAKDKDHFTADDFRRAMIPRGPMGFAPGDGPSIPVLVRGSSRANGRSTGAKLDEPARSSTSRPLMEGNGEALKLIGPKPVIFVFGNFTWPFRGMYPDVDAVLHRRTRPFVMVVSLEAPLRWVRWSPTRVRWRQTTHDLRRTSQCLRTIPQAACRD